MAQEMLQTQLDSWISAGRAEGRTEGEIGERRRALLDLAAVWLKPPEVKECRVALDRMTLDEMPTVRDLYQALQDATEARAALLALLRPPASV